MTTRSSYGTFLSVFRGTMEESKATDPNYWQGDLNEKFKIDLVDGSARVAQAADSKGRPYETIYSHPIPVAAVDQLNMRACIVTWSLKIVCFTKEIKDRRCYLGITNHCNIHHQHLLNTGNNRKYYAINTLNGEKMSCQTLKWEKFDGNGFARGDILGIELNIGKKTIDFYHNNSFIGTMFDNIDLKGFKNFYLALSIPAKEILPAFEICNCSVVLFDHKPKPPIAQNFNFLDVWQAHLNDTFTVDKKDATIKTSIAKSDSIKPESYETIYSEPIPIGSITKLKTNNCIIIWSVKIVDLLPEKRQVYFFLTNHCNLHHELACNWGNNRKYYGISAVTGDKISSETRKWDKFDGMKFEAGDRLRMELNIGGKRIDFYHNNWFVGTMFDNIDLNDWKNCYFAVSLDDPSQVIGMENVEVRFDYHKGQNGLKLESLQIAQSEIKELTKRLNQVTMKYDEICKQNELLKSKNAFGELFDASGNKISINTGNNDSQQLELDARIQKYLKNYMSESERKRK